MPELVLAASATAVATGLGAIPVWLLGARAEALRPALIGIAAGVMTVAAIVGLLLPALDEGEPPEVAVGFVLGVGFLMAAQALLERPGPQRSRDGATAALVFLVLLVHSLPEGFAIGTAYASDTEGLGFFVVAAIAIQNVPEGTSVAIPLAAIGASRSRQFWAAVLTSVPQPVGAVAAYLLVEEISGLLPISFAFASGAMLALVIAKLGPGERTQAGGWGAGAVGGAIVMLLISRALSL
jgi:ZIP family zinc transporter